jgi:hypothetical protein
MSLTRLSLIAVLVSACASGGGGSAAAPLSGEGSAYVYEAGGALHRRDTRAGRAEPIVRNVDEVLAAAASLGGRRLALAFRSGGATSVVAIDNETGAIANVHQGGVGAAYTLGWSTDGERLGVGIRDAGGGVRVVEGSGEARDMGCQSDEFVAWRSASEAIVSDRTNFYTVRSGDCGTLATVVPLGKSNIGFSPNGRRLAYYQDRSVTFANRAQPEVIPELWIAAHDGSGARVIADYQSRPQGSVWSPDGDRIVYEVVSRRWANTMHLVIYDVPGNSYSYEASEKQLGVPSDFGACWSPDGRRIAHERSYARVGQGLTYTTRHVVVRSGADEKVVFEELIGDAPAGASEEADLAPCQWMGTRHLLISTRRGQRLIGVDDGTVQELPADQRVLAAAVFGAAP